eukprot:scaffold216967_cov30-Tisochrysis_lutea.AAC.1
MGHSPLSQRSGHGSHLPVTTLWGWMGHNPLSQHSGGGSQPSVSTLCGYGLLHVHPLPKCLTLQGRRLGGVYASLCHHLQGAAHITSLQTVRGYGRGPNDKCALLTQKGKKAWLRQSGCKLAAVLLA